jgi:hypothetical protein
VTVVLSIHIANAVTVVLPALSAAAVAAVALLSVPVSAVKRTADQSWSAGMGTDGIAVATRTYAPTRTFGPQSRGSSG